MKKIFFITIILIQISFLNTPYSLAQNFAPLSLGNVWVWEKVEWGTIEKSVVVDTNYIINDRSYNRILLYDSSDIYVFNRFKSIDSLFYRYQSNYPYNDGEYPYYKFNCILGDTFSYPMNPFAMFTKEVVDAYQTNVFDTILTVKIIHWNAGGLVEGIEVWTDEFGMLYKENWEGGGTEFILRGCVINGIVYGDTAITVSVEDEPFTEFNFKLHQNYPNPFNPNTTIEYELREYSTVNLKVYDLLGSEVAILVNEEKYPGKYSVTFNGSNLVSGIYFYKLTIGGKTQVRKMILLR